MTQPADLQNLSPDQLRTLVMQLQETVTTQAQGLAERDASIHQLQTHKDKLTHELALLRRHRFGKRSEGMDKHQLTLLCNPPENPEQLLVENSTKLKEGSFLCEHQDTATARYWRF